MPRPLRVLFLANNGTSVGHVMRCAAVARALSSVAGERDVPFRAVLATTSEAQSVLDDVAAAVVRLPSPGRAAGLEWDETDRRRMVQGILEGLVESFAPDVLVADTFPSGPHLEAATILERIPRRLLIRRGIRADRAGDAVVTHGLKLYQRVLLPADPHGSEERDGTSIPPITLLDGPPTLNPEAARRALGLGPGRWALLTSGGGGDREKSVSLEEMARLVREHGQFRPVIAPGVFAPEKRQSGYYRDLTPRLECVPLQPYLNAFEIIISAAGYNQAHEAAIAARPLILFGIDRSHDDQMDRVRRFVAAGLAVGLERPERIGEALDAVQGLRPPGLVGGGARVAARHILDLAEQG